MTLLECLQDLLITQDATLAAKLPGGLRPRILPQTSVQAFQTMAVVRIISGLSEPPTHDSGASSWARVRIEITVWSVDDLSAEQAAIYIRAKMAPISGFLSGTSGKFCCSEIQGPRTMTDDLGRLAGSQIDILGLLNWSTLS